MLIVRGVNVFPSQIEEIVVALPQLSGQFRSRCRATGMDRLDLAVELRSEAAASVSESDRAALARELQHRIKTMVGVSSGVTVLAAGGIPATATGKARRVIDRRHRLIPLFAVQPEETCSMDGLKTWPSRSMRAGSQPSRCSAATCSTHSTRR